MTTKTTPNRKTKIPEINKLTKTTLKSRILAASKTGAAPSEIAKILKTTVGTVYVVRAAAKRSKADTSTWYSQHTKKAKKTLLVATDHPQNLYRESNMMNAFRGYQFTEPTKEPFQKAPSFVQRLKSAFSALMGN